MLYFKPHDIFQQQVDLFMFGSTSKDMKYVTKQEYEDFCKEFIFDELKGEHFGQAFCKRFDITDRVLNILHSRKSAELHIKTLGYIRN